MLYSILSLPCFVTFTYEGNAYYIAEINETYLLVCAYVNDAWQAPANWPREDFGVTLDEVNLALAPDALPYTPDQSSSLLESLLDYDVLHEAVLECLMVGNVKFRRNFGRWKAGAKVCCLTFNFCSGQVIEHDDNGNEIDRCNFMLLPLDEPTVAVVATDNQTELRDVPEGTLFVYREQWYQLLRHNIGFNNRWSCDIQAYGPDGNAVGSPQNVSLPMLVNVQ